MPSVPFESCKVPFLMSIFPLKFSIVTSSYCVFAAFVWIETFKLVGISTTPETSVFSASSSVS